MRHIKFMHVNCFDVTRKETTINSFRAIRLRGFYWIMLLQKLNDLYLRKDQCTIVIKKEIGSEMAIYFHQYYLTPFSDLLVRYVHISIPVHWYYLRSVICKPWNLTEYLQIIHYSVTKLLARWDEPLSRMWI